MTNRSQSIRGPRFVSAWLAAAAIVAAEGCSGTKAAAPVAPASASTLASAEPASAADPVLKSCQSTSGGTFLNWSFPAQKGKFVANFWTRVTDFGHDGSAIGFSKGAGDGYGTMGVILYFLKD